jgi:hypothetical protein
MKTTVQHKIGTVLLALFSLVMLATLFTINLSSEEAVELSALGTMALGLMPWLGAVKVLATVGLWTNRFRTLSALVLTGYLGGLMMTGLVTGEGPWVGGVLTLVLWIAMELRTGNFLKINN